MCPAGGGDHRVRAATRLRVWCNDPSIWTIFFFPPLPPLTQVNINKAPAMRWKYKKQLIRNGMVCFRVRKNNQRLCKCPLIRLCEPRGEEEGGEDAWWWFICLSDAVPPCSIDSLTSFQGVLVVNYITLCQIQAPPRRLAELFRLINMQVQHMSTVFINRTAFHFNDSICVYSRGLLRWRAILIISLKYYDDINNLSENIERNNNCHVIIRR